MFNQRFLDTASQYLNHSVLPSILYISLSLYILVVIMCQIMNGVNNFAPEIFTSKAKRILSQLIQNKVERISPIDFENTGELDCINKAELDKDNAITFIIYFCFTFIFYVTFFLFLVWYLFSIKQILVVLFLLIFVPTLRSHIVRIKVYNKLEDASAPIRRENNYYINVM